MELNDGAKKVFQLKYAKNRTKSWKEIVNRIVEIISSGEKNYNTPEEKINEYKQEFYNMIYELQFIPGGRIIANSGTGIKNLSNCFVLSIEDSRTSIYKTLGQAAEVFAAGGGLGYNFSHIREKGSPIVTTGGKASGPVSFMTLFDQTGEVIQQASRRGAQIAILSVTHPDIEEFVDFKSTPNDRNKRLLEEYHRNLKGVNGTLHGTKYYNVLEKTLLDDQLTHFNVSVAITDEFMQAVEEDKDWELKSIVEDKVVKTVKARDLLMKIAEHAWKSGDPGVLFLGRINQDNIVPYLGQIESVNPCFTADTLILTDEGYEQIGTVAAFEKYNLVTAKGDIVEGKARNTGMKKIYILNLSTNKKIKCTADHIFMNVSGEEVKAIDTKGVQLKPYLKYPKLDDYFTLLGFIQGDGVLGRLKSEDHLGVEVNIGKKDQDILKLLEGHKYTSGERSIYLQDIKEDLIKNKFDNRKLPEREFPYEYLNWNQYQRASFLRGCFSANGCINSYGRITYKSTSKKFIEQLKGNLEVQFGIYSYITTNKSHPIKFSNGTYTVKESYDLNISDFESKTIFFNRVNFYQQYKIEKLERLLNEQVPFVQSIKYLGEQEVFDFSLPDYHWGVIEGFVAHNCGEVGLLPGESCVLGSLNLHAFYDKKNKAIDFMLLEKVTRLATRFLEDTVEVSEAPVEFINYMTKNLRRLGLGVMGFADLLVDLDIPYGSKDSITLAEYLSWFIQFYSWHESIRLAEQRGAFNFYDESKVNFDVIVKVLNSEHTPFIYDIEVLKKQGIRNNGTMSLAPTGSIAIIGGVNSGIEPFFALAYKRNITEGVGNIATDSLFEINPALEGKLKEYDYIEEDRKDILEYASVKGTIKDCPKVSKEFQDIFRVANEISKEDHIAIQAAWQKYVSNAISKTINLPENATIEDVYNIYLQMWKAGLKGGTIYRDHSKVFQILEQPGKE